MRAVVEAPRRRRAPASCGAAAGDLEGGRRRGGAGRGARGGAVWLLALACLAEADALPGGGMRAAHALPPSTTPVVAHVFRHAHLRGRGAQAAHHAAGAPPVRRDGAIRLRGGLDPDTVHQATVWAVSGFACLHLFAANRMVNWYCPMKEHHQLSILGHDRLMRYKVGRMIVSTFLQQNLGLSMLSVAVFCLFYYAGVPLSVCFSVVMVNHCLLVLDKSDLYGQAASSSYQGHYDHPHVRVWAVIIVIWTVLSFTGGLGFIPMGYIIKPWGVLWLINSFLNVLDPEGLLMAGGSKFPLSEMHRQLLWEVHVVSFAYCSVLIFYDWGRAWVHALFHGPIIGMCVAMLLKDPSTLPNGSLSRLFWAAFALLEIYVGYVGIGLKPFWRRRRAVSHEPTISPGAIAIREKGDLIPISQVKHQMPDL